MLNKIPIHLNVKLKGEHILFIFDCDFLLKISFMEFIKR